MSTIAIVFIWLLNFGISWLNAHYCGVVWAETKAVGGWRRFMTWMGALMSASGFTWCYLIIGAFIAHSLGYMPDDATKVALELGFLIIMPGVLFSGLMITIDSWATSFRQGGWMNYGVSIWNTYAQIHNTLSAIDTFGSAFSDVFSYFGGRKSSSSSSSSSSGDDDANGIFAIIIIAIVVAACVAGFITTTIIIKRNAARQPLPKR